MKYCPSVLSSFFCSLGEACSHVLYKIEKAVRSGLTQLTTPADMPCQWNQNIMTNVNAVEINFYSQEAKRKIWTKTVGLVNVAATNR